MPRPDPFGARASLGDGLPDYWRLAALGDLIDLDTAPVTLRILLENALRNVGGGLIERADVETLAAWRPGSTTEAEVPFMPSRVLLQDFTGVPAIVDLAAMRDAMADLGGDPARVNPLVPADLVIDHSVQVDQFGTSAAFAFNVAREYERGIVLGGSGNGEAMAANRIKKVRCALCWNEELARLARQHNDSNVLSLGQRVTPEDTVLDIVRVWLETPFEGGRHVRRIELLDAD